MNALALPLALSLLAAPAAQDSTEYERLFQALRSLAPDPDNGASVSGLTLTRDAGRLVLEEGQLFLLAPIGDRVVGAVFTGSGRFEFVPPSQVERAQLDRFLDSDSLSAELEGVVMIFNDGTLDELRRELWFAPGRPSARSVSLVREAIDFLSDEDKGDFDPPLMVSLLNDGEDGLFHAHINPRRGRPLFFRFDGAQREEVSMGQKARRGDVYDLICSFASSDDSSAPDVAHADLAAVEHYEIVARMEDNYDVSAEATLRLIPGRPGGFWLPFTLFAEMEVGSVVVGGQPSTEHFRGKDSSLLWVFLDRSVREGEPVELTIAYEGDLVDWVEDFLMVKSSDHWYPRPFTDSKSTFDLTFTIPSRYQLASVGTMVSQEDQGDVVTSRWVTPHPSLHASFNVGDFEEYELNDPRIPPVKIQVAEAAHNRLELLRQRDMDQQVGTDIANSLHFFQNTFGTVPVDEFHVTEIPFFHGQAFPGMVQLSWTTFQWTAEEGYDEIFRAHEVAHQWWGLGVTPSTYHDEWLSEGLAEFSGLWYMQGVLMDSEKYFDRLEDARKAIFKRRDKAGPIWLGRRLSTSETEEDYQIVVYEKGAWVFHMLRNMMIDLESMNEEAFTTMLREVYQTFRGHAISTEAFQQIVERHIGIDMDWFFDEWVYGTAVPTYRFAWRGEDTEDGRYKMTARVRSEGVSEDFIMAVPILLDFGDQGYARIRVLVQGTDVEFELPLMPMKPRRVVFNDLKSVLAEVKEEGW